MSRGQIASILCSLTLACRAFCGEPVVVDADYKDACGPFSCLVALRLLGVEADLDQLCVKCSWTKDQPTEFGKMRDVLNGWPGISCRAVKLTPEDLCDVLADDLSVAILAVRKHSEDVNHAVCVAAVDPARETLQWYDYPELEQWRSMAEVANVWDGQALIVSISPLRRSLVIAPWLFLPFFSVVRLCSLLFRKRAFTHLSRTCFLVLLCSVSLMFASCAEESKVAATNAPSLVNELVCDLGIVEPGKQVRGTVEFVNESRTRMRIVDTGVSCSCLRLLSFPEELTPGECAEVELALDVIQESGAHSVQAILRRAQMPPLIVDVRSTVRSCWVEPNAINLGEVSNNAPELRRVSVLAAGYPDARCVRAATGVDWLSVSQVEQPASEGSVRLISLYDIEFDLNLLELGMFQAEVVITVDRGDLQLPLVIPITGNLVGDVVATPPSIVFGVVGEAPIERTCSLSFKHVSTPELKFTTEHPFVTVTVDETNSDLVSVTLVASIPQRIDIGNKGLVRGNLVATDNRNQVVCRVPYTLMIAS